MSKIMIDEATVKLVLEALENSLDLVREDAYQAKQLYGNYPTRQARVGGLKVLADDHEKALTALREALAQPEQEPVAEARYDGTLHWIEPHGVGLHQIQGPLYTTPPPCPTCEALARTVMMDQTGRDA